MHPTNHHHPVLFGSSHPIYSTPSLSDTAGLGDAFALAAAPSTYNTMQTLKYDVDSSLHIHTLVTMHFKIWHVPCYVRNFWAQFQYCVREFFKNRNFRFHIDLKVWLLGLMYEMLI